MRPLVCLVVVVAGYAGCGGDNGKPSNERTATPTEKPARTEPGTPTAAEVRNYACRDVAFGLTNSTAAPFLASAVSREAGVDIDTAARKVQAICERAKPETKPYARAVAALGGGD